MQLTSTKRKYGNSLYPNNSYFDREDGGHVTHPPVYSGGRVCFVCQLTSVLTGVACAVMSVKYISQLGNVGKLTPVQCLTNHIIKTSLHIHLKKKEKKRKKLYPLFQNSSQYISYKLVS